MNVSPSSSEKPDQAEFWNEMVGDSWVRFQEELDAQIGPFGEAAMALLSPQPGEDILDVGCGCGTTTLELARRVGPSGSVLAVDLSGPMLARARERAAGADLENAEFRQADAGEDDFGKKRFDAAYSRFGVMFFEDPPAAFANIGNALKPGGRFVFVCWQDRSENPWMTVPTRCIGEYVEIPPPPAPDEPGPFSLGDPARLRDVLTQAGFGDIEIEGRQQEITIGGDKGLDGAVTYVRHIGPAALPLREAAEEVREQALSAVRDVLAPFETGHGVRMPAAVWLVSASKA